MASTALQVTCVVPTGKLPPLGGTQVVVSDPVPPVAVGVVNVTGIGKPRSDATVRSDGQTSVIGETGVGRTALSEQAHTRAALRIHNASKRLDTDVGPAGVLWASPASSAIATTFWTTEVARKASGASGIAANIARL